MSAVFKTVKPPDWFDRYVRSVLTPELNIELDGLLVQRPRLGVKSEVYILTPSAGRPLVFRILRKSSEDRRLKASSRFANEVGLPAPGLLFARTRLSHHLRWGFGVIVEEKLEGEHREEMNADLRDLERLAAALAHLHSFTRTRWGLPGRPRSIDFYKNWIARKFLNRIARLRDTGQEIADSDLSRILQFISIYDKIWDRTFPFSLTHDKINPGNVLFAEDGVKFLDLDTLRYGAAPKDLVTAEYFFCASSAHAAFFRRAYFDRAGRRMEKHFHNYEPLYRAWFHLSRWAARANDAASRKKKGKKVTASTELARKSEAEAFWYWIDECLRVFGYGERNTIAPPPKRFPLADPGPPALTATPE